jgi:hypothetical protein
MESFTPAPPSSVADFLTPEESSVFAEPTAPAPRIYGESNVFAEEDPTEPVDDLDDGARDPADSHDPTEPHV